MRPEDLIGLKVQAIANNAERESADMADIEALMRHHGHELDWRLIEEYFDLFEMEHIFNRLQERYHGIH